MARVTVEFIVEPFTEGVLGPHVTAALDALRSAGLEPDVGPFGNTVTGDGAEVFPALSAASTAAFANGATTLELTARRVETQPDEAEEFLAAMRSVAKAVHGRLVSLEESTPDDTALLWRGAVVGALRIPSPVGDLRRGLDMLVSEVEAELGGSLLTLSRADKQRAVRLLDERGAFSVRNAVDDVADAIGVSRVTVYNYLKVARAGSQAVSVEEAAPGPSVERRAPLDAHASHAALGNARRHTDASAVNATEG
jgi:uncharacterized protein YqgV (UPF0045/DUF77 family)/transposase-like protein